MAKLYNEYPTTILFPSIGSSKEGYISVAEVDKNIPFEIKRVYWTYFTPNDVTRGFHAHRELQQVIFAVSGRIVFTTIDKDGRSQEFVLDNPNMGLYLPPFTWREIKFSHSAVLLCMASEAYLESDYIRDYSTFENEIGKQKV